MDILKTYAHYQEALTRMWKMATPGIRLDLAPMRTVMKALGDPWNDFPSILIAGTNGKGSTAAMLCQVLASSGYKTGLYTSPHLVSYKERIRVKTSQGDLPFNDQGWCRAFAKVEKAVEETGASLTQFELLTAVCFLMFQDAGVDLAVLEVGLGGRLDATNVVEPVLSLIAPIGFDHQEYLGSALSSIAGEKAGILRKNTPAITLTQEEEALTVLESEAARIGADFGVIEPGVLRGFTLKGQSFSYQGKLYATRLIGEHQVQNASLVIEAALALRKSGWEIPDEKITEGLEMAEWPARFEVVCRSPVVILDGAHNPHGAATLSRLLRSLELPEPRILAIGILEGKDAPGILRELSGWADEWIFCRSFHPKSLSTARLLETMRSIAPPRKFRVCERVGEACREALSMLRGKGTLCMAGSLTVAGEARRILRHGAHSLS